MAGNSMKTSGGFKMRNFDESGEFATDLQKNHITDFWVNPKNDESREIFTHESREMDSALPLRGLIGVEL